MKLFKPTGSVSTNGAWQGTCADYYNGRPIVGSGGAEKHGSEYSVLIMQQYKCKHFRRVVTGIWCQLGNCRADLGVVTRQFYCISQQKSVPQMCHCNAVSVSLYLPISLSLFPCLSVCLSNYVSCNFFFFFLLGHPHTVAYCNIAYVWCSVCLCACLRLSVNHLKIVFSFQLFIYCGTCSHSICHAAPEATAATT